MATAALPPVPHSTTPPWRSAEGGGAASSSPSRSSSSSRFSSQSCIGIQLWRRGAGVRRRGNSTISCLVFLPARGCQIDFNAEVAMPHSAVIVLTDPASAFSVGKSNTAVLPIKGDYSRGNLMLQRIISYIEFLETRLKGLLERPKQINHYIFTDSDIAVVDELGHIFRNYPRFHLALSFRNNRDQPINSGFIAVRGTRDGILRAKIFLQRVLEVYSSKYMKASRMLGDQLALAWIVKSQISLDTKMYAKSKPFKTEIHGTAVLFLPCAVYNWTPPEGAGQFHGMPLDVKVVHFKGSRKRLMLESWNFFNSSSSIPDMLCLILMSGRAKYDF